jgi:hypothetical protein
VLRLLITANVVPSSLILSSLMMEAMRCSETPVHTRATPRNIPEDGIFHSYRRENLKSYKFQCYSFECWSLYDRYFVEFVVSTAVTMKNAVCNTILQYNTIQYNTISTWRHNPEDILL